MTYGTRNWLYRETNDIMGVSRRMGHSSPNVTASVYVHEMKGATEEQAAALQSWIDKQPSHSAR